MILKQETKRRKKICYGDTSGVPFRRQTKDAFLTGSLLNTFKKQQKVSETGFTLKTIR